MTILMRRDDTFQNPIVWQEFTHQRRAAPRAFRHWRIIGPLILGLTMAFIVLSLSNLQYPTRDFAIFTLWIVHSATAIRAIVACSNAISRERFGQTWDA